MYPLAHIHRELGYVKHQYETMKVEYSKAILDNPVRAMRMHGSNMAVMQYREQLANSLRQNLVRNNPNTDEAVKGIVQYELKGIERMIDEANKMSLNEAPAIGMLEEANRTALMQMRGLFRVFLISAPL